MMALYSNYSYRLAHQCVKGKVRLFAVAQARLLATSGINPLSDKDFNFPEDATPQGVQGSLNENCPTLNLWLDNCRRYGLANCDQQLQGIQTGRKTLAEVLVEQEKLIADIAERYRSNLTTDNAQGVQTDVALLPEVNMPCPQGIQGEDCARFKLWLENCHRFGFGNCMEHLSGFRGGRKTLAEIFAEQDQAIREVVMRVEPGKVDSEGVKSDVKEEAVLTAGQKLQRAVKEYGSTVMIFHISISLMSLGFFYTLVNSGIDVVGLMSRMGIGGDSMQAKIAGGTGTFVVAYAVHKVFAPARIAATLTATPLIVRYLRRIGFLKTPKTTQPKAPKSESPNS